VIAVPAPLVVQRDDEQVSAFEVLQGGLTIVQAPGDLLPPGSGENGITQGTTHAAKDGGAQQKCLDTRGLPLQHFFDQVIQHEMVAAGERLDEAGGVLMPLHRERGHLQAGNPAFGAGFQRGDLPGREVEAHDLVEEIGRLRGGEAQIGCTQLGHLPPAAQTGQGELRILTGGDDQAHLRRLVFEQKGQSLANRFGIHQVVVVKDEDEFPARGRDLVQERGQECFDGWRLGRLKRSQHP